MASTPSEPPATKVAKEPFAPPSLAEDAKPPTTTFAHLTADEQAKHERIREWLSADEYKLDDKPLDEAERFWLSEECIQRYVRASKGVEQTAKTRLEATLRWRREYGFGTELMNPESFSVEGETGKQIIFGYDHARRPALYLLPSRQNTDGPPQQIRYSVFMLESTIGLMSAGVENLALLINWADKAKNPSLGTARTFLDILQSHYPERLGAAYLVHMPFFVSLFLKAITPFIDPKTRTKLFLNPDMVKDNLIKGDELLTIAGWGGNVEFDYDHTVYWPTLLKLCGDRRARELGVWREMGSKIGTSEWEVKCKAHGGPTPGLESQPGLESEDAKVQRLLQDS